jgi:hypothetical protein
MQYILTEEEYNTLKNAVNDKRVDFDTQLLEFCMSYAENLPKQSPHGCIIMKTARYCSNCPVKSICPCKYKEYPQ